MAKSGLLRVVIALLLLVQLSFAANSPESSPSPTPDSPADEISPSVQSPPEIQSPPSHSPSPSPADSPVASSPPSPPLPPSSPFPVSEDAPGPAPSADDDYPPPAPVPAPSQASDVSHSDMSATIDEEKKSSGMSGGKKAGIVIGLFGAACLAGIAGCVVKKRQENIRKSRYGYTARSEILLT